MYATANAAPTEVEPKAPDTTPRGRGQRRALFALALGTFAIGTGEFGTNGVIELYAEDLDASLPLATWAVTAYALGVVIGSPIITIAAARLNRKRLLLGLIGLFLVGNLFSAWAMSMDMLIAARFVTGTVQGAYFGAGAVVASYLYGAGKAGKAFATVMAGLTVATIFGSPAGTFIGQMLGWEWLYLVVAAIGLLAGLALLMWIPSTPDLDGGSVRSELRAFTKPLVWVMVAIAALGISSIFAVYTFIAPIVTDAAGQSPAVIPIALAVFGLGMAAGNALGGRIADRHLTAGLVLGYLLVSLSLIVVGIGGAWLPSLFIGLFGVGASAMMAIPTIQVLLTRFAPDAPTLVGSLNLAALNAANAFGAVGGAIVIGAGYGVLATSWAGLVLVLAGLAVFALFIPRALNATRSR
ncbi:MFS transporter [Microbacterium insulae]|uniref:MFS transporter n=1 Tax=Microbacterium insulae TaxID=483014 RepID=A0ABW3AH95_9MICO